MERLIGTGIVADAHGLSAAGAAAILYEHGSIGTINVVSTFLEVRQALEFKPTTKILLIDAGLPGLDRLGLVANLRKIYIHLLIVIMSDRADRALMLSALEAGAHGFVPKHLPTKDMAAAFRTVLAGHVFVPGQLAASADGSGIVTPFAKARGTADLSARQIEVLQLLRGGKTNKEIARILGIAEATVKVHMSAAYRKLGVHNRVGAASARHA